MPTVVPTAFFINDRKVFGREFIDDDAIQNQSERMKNIGLIIMARFTIELASVLSMLGYRSIWVIKPSP
jgi:hypothetical protein